MMRKDRMNMIQTKVSFALRCTSLKCYGIRYVTMHLPHL
jgi:hypothetical protein